MRELRERSYFRRIIFSRPVFLFLVFVVVLTTMSVFKAYKKSRIAILKNREVENELRELLDKKNALESNINRLKAPFGIEEELREKFQVKKPGEEFVVIVDEKLPESEIQEKDEGGGSFLEKTWDFVKNIF